MGQDDGGDPGGLIGLHVLLGKYSEDVEADLLWRGIDLRGLWTGELSWRRLKILIDHLPPESATKTAIREELGDDFLSAMVIDADVPAPHGPWSRLETLVATVADSVNDLAFITVSLAMGEKAKRPDPPARTPRPGVKRPVSNKPSAAALAFIAAEREQRRAHLSLVQDGA